MDAGGHFALQTVDKLLQIATLLLLTACRNLPMPYPTVPSPTLYNVPFSHNTYVRDNRRRTTEYASSLSTVG